MREWTLSPRSHSSPEGVPHPTETDCTAANVPCASAVKEEIHSSAPRPDVLSAEISERVVAMRALAREVRKTSR